MNRRRLATLLALLVAIGGGYWLGTTRSARRAADTGAEARAVYQCAMHPQVVQDHPGNCPICGMALQRVDLGEHQHAAAPGIPAVTAAAPTAAPERRVKGDRHPMRPEMVPGHASFTLSRERQQLIGVTRGRVGVRPLQVEVRAVGRVAYDPALYRAIVDYREAIRARGALGRNALDDARAGNGALVRGAYLRLLQQGLSEDQIRALARAERDPTELLLPGDRVWIYAQVYEYEAPLVKPGQAMTVTVPSQPGRELRTTVAAVDAILDPATRTVRVRGLVQTPDKELRPESFVQVRISVPLGDELAVPSEAVLDTGDHQIVFVVHGEGRFEPRSVKLGRTAQGYYEVLAGLADGDEVVTSANFLIDSESRFRAALAAFAPPAPPAH